MNPVELLTRPVGNVIDAFSMLFRAVFVVGLCYVINRMTSPGVWWVQWVALGMGIAVLVAWARALRSIVGTAIVGYVGYWIYKRYGEQARAQFDAWRAGRNGGASPDPAQSSSLTTTSTLPPR
jgi:hypothetical protein